MKFARSPYDPSGTPLWPDPQEDEPRYHSWFGGDPAGDPDDADREDDEERTTWYPPLDDDDGWFTWWPPFEDGGAEP